MICGFAHRRLGGVAAVPEAKRPIGKLAGLPVFERPANRIEPVGIFDRPMNHRGCGLVRWWLDLVFNISRERPFVQAAGQTVKQVL